MFQIVIQSVAPFNLEVGEHRDIESEKYYIDNISHINEKTRLINQLWYLRQNKFII